VTPERGRLVAFEGVDGSGKSTQARILAASIGAVLTFEPGATELGRSLRRLLLDPDHPVPDLRAEALLMAADRAQHVAEVIRPALEAQRDVVTDRFSGSTLAYQGYGRGLSVDALAKLVDWGAGGVRPDLTVVVDVPLEVARHRMREVPADRLERLDEAFFTRVRDGYLELAGADPVAWVVVDGGRDVDAVAAEVRGVLEHRLGVATTGEQRT
jgi:dTMP kinase